MPLDTTKSVKSITYNGTTIPLYAKPEQTKTVDLSMASGNQVVSPDGGKVLSSVTITKPSTLVAENIKKDVNIGGVVGTLESGTSSKIQPSKSLTITSNGTTTITPDEPYDAMGQVDLTVNAGGSAGYKVTFPATATNWSKLGTSCLIYADGTTSTHTDYSTLAGKTFESVVAMVFGENGISYYQLKATLSSGAIILYSQFLVPFMVSVTFAPDTVPTPMGTAINFNWIPIADTVISAIEAYNTD